ncbi:HIT domain-containing protein [Nocardia abscessus]|uniref:HIT domain-containing protein n=1 Tax=Nocardia abscessus TaxID=120957 RepID=A0ABS0C9W9_9NOCA|nr:HIT domain-containing protein [Nocardia abscessus]
MRDADWYCDEVIPRLVEVDVVIETDQILAFRPPDPGFGVEHVIVVPKKHVRSLLELDPVLGAGLLEVVQAVAQQVVSEHGGCQVLTTLGNEQHNKHLHMHVAAGAGVARFVTRSELRE